MTLRQRLFGMTPELVGVFPVLVNSFVTDVRVLLPLIRSPHVRLRDTQDTGWWGLAPRGVGIVEARSALPISSYLRSVFIAPAGSALQP